MSQYDITKDLRREIEKKLDKTEFHKNKKMVDEYLSRLDYRLIPVERKTEVWDKYILKLVEDTSKLVTQMTIVNSETAKNTEAIERIREEGATFYDKLIKGVLSKLFKGVFIKILWYLALIGVGGGTLVYIVTKILEYTGEM